MVCTKLLAALAVGAGAFAPTPNGRIPAEYAKNITVYHLNPIGAGAIPGNMNTGDAEGDLNFYLGQFFLPLECADPNADILGSFDCTNPERTADLVVTKVDMEVDARFTNYSTCNFCDTGIDPVSYPPAPCEIGTYVCDCSYGKVCDPIQVGVELRKPNLPPQICTTALAQKCSAVRDNGTACVACTHENFDDLKAAQCGDGKISDYCPLVDSCEVALDSMCGTVQANYSTCNDCQTAHAEDLATAGCGKNDGRRWCPSASCTAKPGDEWKCWRATIPQKAGGFWYSHSLDGLCNESSAPGSCSWRVLSTSTVHEQCLRGYVADAVEAADTAACFAACGPRNESSSCWIGCFFDTLLGPEAQHNDSRGAVTGMPLEAIIKTGWEKPFLSESAGGCPKVEGHFSMIV